MAAVAIRMYKVREFRPKGQQKSVDLATLAKSRYNKPFKLTAGSVTSLASASDAPEPPAA
jgi:hypothetical protein